MQKTVYCTVLCFMASIIGPGKHFIGLCEGFFFWSVEGSLDAVW